MTQTAAQNFSPIITKPRRTDPPSLDIGYNLQITTPRLFWRLQIVGWLLFGLIRWIYSIALGREPDQFEPVFVSVAVGFCLTLFLRYSLKYIWPRGVAWVLALAVPLIGLSAFIYSATEIYSYTTFYDTDWIPHPREFLGIAFIQSFLLTGWLGLYLGLKFYIQYREESNHVLRMTAMAHEAQLAMLRYQLNPHFLFNTLNAISTLVLEGQNKLASRMLDKLSAFLRYSLVNQPTDKVTLAQELDALNLYLDIEKVRFDDRLEIRLEVEAETRNSLVPSLLLQPLIENAIKYAIGPAEAGGVITVKAREQGGRLVLRVADTGPGLPEDGFVPSKTGSGVGLNNTRERLQQLYGSDYTFDMANRETGGLVVNIDLPFETS